jgi:hypothetical protein
MPEDQKQTMLSARISSRMIKIMEAQDDVAKPMELVEQVERWPT